MWTEEEHFRLSVSLPPKIKQVFLPCSHPHVVHNIVVVHLNMCYGTEDVGVDVSSTIIYNRMRIQKLEEG